MSHLRHSTYGSQAPRGNMSLVFYAERYHPVQAGSIDGTDTAPHDRGIKRALQAYKSGLYDPFSDSKMVGNPLKTLFVSRLSPTTTEEDLKQVLERYGPVRTLRLVRDVVSGASKRYAFVEFEEQRDLEEAYKCANGSLIHDSSILVDWNRQRLMPGWIPRRFGGGLSGVKTSGQLRFGGRDKPFRAPLRPVPTADLERLGIMPPPTGNFMRAMDVAPLPPPMQPLQASGGQRATTRMEGQGGWGEGGRAGRERRGGMGYGPERKWGGDGGDGGTRMGDGGGGGEERGKVREDSGGHRGRFSEGGVEGERGSRGFDKAERRGEGVGKKKREGEREKNIRDTHRDGERERFRERDRGRGREGDRDGDRERKRMKVRGRERSESRDGKQSRGEMVRRSGGEKGRVERRHVSEDENERWSFGR